MSAQMTRDVFGFLAFGLLAIKFASDWKTDGWFGHGSTIITALVCVISLAAAIHSAATQ